jgi:protein-S-isoprenylcysteine O-methyltransferase Ste14
MAAVEDHRPNRIPWPPLIYLAAVGAGLGFHRLYPLPWFEDPMADVLQGIGVILAAAAVSLDLWSMALFRKHKTTILPHRAADSLIIEGPFSWSRNPIYLGNTALVAAAGLFFGTPWLIVLALIAAVITQKLAIEREEKHLASKFGAAWTAYEARVRRWL